LGFSRSRWRKAAKMATLESPYGGTSSRKGRFHTDDGATNDSLRRAPQRVSNAKSSGTGDQTSAGAVRFEPRSSPSQPVGRLERELLGKSIELLDDLEIASTEDASLLIESLRNVCSRLWSSAATASQYHQSILVMVESVVASADPSSVPISSRLVSALRGAMKDLANESLNETFVEVVRSQLIDQGLNPMSILTNYAPNDSQ
jgi:hypothetical protein